MKKPWSDKKKSKIQSILGTMPLSEVAKELGIDEATLLSACSRYGWSYAYERKSPERLTSEAKAFIKRYAGIVSVQDMATKFKVPPGRIRSWASYKKISLRLPSYRSVHTTIPNEDIELMRRLHDEHLSCAEIARKFEISHGYCWQVCNYLNRIDC